MREGGNGTEASRRVVCTWVLLSGPIFCRAGGGAQGGWSRRACHGGSYDISTCGKLQISAVKLNQPVLLFFLV